MAKTEQICLYLRRTGFTGGRLCGKTRYDPLQSACGGDVVIARLPCEVFAAIGLRVQAALAANRFHGRAEPPATWLLADAA